MIIPEHGTKTKNQSTAICIATNNTKSLRFEEGWEVLSSDSTEPSMNEDLM